MSSETTTQDLVITLSVNTEMTYNELRKVEMSILRILSYIRRFSGNEQIDKAIQKVMQLISAIRMAQIAIRALEIAEGPIGWIYAITTTVGAAIAVGTTVNDLSGG